MRFTLVWYWYYFCTKNDIRDGASSVQRFHFKLDLPVYSRNTKYRRRDLSRIKKLANWALNIILTSSVIFSLWIYFYNANLTTSSICGRVYPDDVPAPLIISLPSEKMTTQRNLLKSHLLRWRNSGKKSSFWEDNRWQNEVMPWQGHTSA